MIADEDIDIEDLVGEEFDFYGVSGNCFRLDDQTYEVVEDEQVIAASDDHLRGMPIARVVVEETFGEYTLIDLHDGHEWLKFGVTRSLYNDDLEMFFEYTPKGIE